MQEVTEIKKNSLLSFPTWQYKQISQASAAPFTGGEARKVSKWQEGLSLQKSTQWDETPCRSFFWKTSCKWSSTSDHSRTVGLCVRIKCSEQLWVFFIMHLSSLSHVIWEVFKLQKCPILSVLSNLEPKANIFGKDFCLFCFTKLSVAISLSFRLHYVLRSCSVLVFLSWRN